MRKRKVYHLLCLLTSEDQERFTLFLNSPYFNASPTLILFWNQWKDKVIPASSEREISEKEFLEGTPLKASRVDALCWELSVKIREFLTVEGLKTRPEAEVLLYTQSMLNRDPGMEIVHRFIADMEKELAELPNTPEKDLAFLFHQDMFIKAKTAARRSDVDWYAEFAGVQACLANYFRVKSLQWSCGAANAGQVFREAKKNPAPPFFASTLLEPLPENETPIPHLFRLCLFLLTESTQQEALPKILAILQQKEIQISSSIRFEVYGYVLNHCIRQVNKGDQSFLPPIFEVYKLLYPVDRLPQTQKIYPQQLKNVISIACRTGNLQWGLAFMNLYQPLLPELDRDLALQFNRGVLSFYQGDFKSAIQLFQSAISTRNQDPFYGLDARIYLWKAYYESRARLSAFEADEMYKLYDSFRVYVHRNQKISESHQQQFRNLVRQFKRLMSCVEEPDPKKKHSSLIRFQKKLKATGYVANITWLLKKVEEALESC